MDTVIVSINQDPRFPVAITYLNPRHTPEIISVEAWASASVDEGQPYWITTRDEAYALGEERTAWLAPDMVPDGFGGAETQPVLTKEQLVLLALVAQGLTAAQAKAALQAAVTEQAVVPPEDDLDILNG